MWAPLAPVRIFDSAPSGRTHDLRGVALPFALPPTPPAFVVMADAVPMRQEKAEPVIPGPAALTGIPSAEPEHCTPSAQILILP